MVIFAVSYAADNAEFRERNGNRKQRINGHNKAIVIRIVSVLAVIVVVITMVATDSCDNNTTNRSKTAAVRQTTCCVEFPLFFTTSS